MQLTVTRDSYTGHAKSPWLVVIPRRVSPTGRRQYRRFASKSKAQAFVSAVKMQVRDGGEHPITAVPADLAADATSAARLLEGSGLTLTEAVRLLLSGERAESVAISPYPSYGGAGAAARPGRVSAGPGAAAPLSLSATLALVDEAKAHQAAATIRTRRSVCAALFARNPGMADWHLHACTPHAIQSALDKAWPRSPQCWNTGRRVLSALFGYAIKRQLVSMDNPVAALELKRVHETEIVALPPDELRALFAACRPATPEEVAAARGLPPSARHRAGIDTTNLRPYLAVCAFAGVRPVECSRLTWGDINLEEGVVSVRASNSKTGGTRHIELHDTLRAWLIACRPAGATDDDLLTPAQGLAARLGALRRRAGYNARRPWQNDCLRHSFATYWLKAGIGTLENLQYNMGHRDTRLLYTRYTNMRGVTRTMAENWWQILPDACGGGAGEA